MTFTSHGHHIPGTVDTDELEGTSRARCGGPKLCDKCKIEAVRALPDDSIAKASLLNDLDALVVQEPTQIPLEIYRPHINNVIAMQFLGGEESAFDMIVWLTDCGFQATHWPEFKNKNIKPFRRNSDGREITRSIAERIEYVIDIDHVRKIFVGDWLVLGFTDIYRSRFGDGESEFSVIRAGDFEKMFERASANAPVPWNVVYTSENALQPELDTILDMKTARTEFQEGLKK